MTITVVGTGLIGGSMALSLKEKGFAHRIIGVDADRAHLEKALELGLIDEAMPLDQAVAASSVVILAIPVDALITVLPQVLDAVTEQVVVEVGSTKEQFLQKIKQHPRRGRLVATHPMAGTEYSGPEAAVHELFEGKCCVLCDTADSDADAVELVKRLYETLGMRVVYMDAVAHDLHAAYVSHISHITSFALALTVLEKEKEEAAIFELAGGGFASTVRLAKSSPDMWVPIFKQNRKNVLDVLHEHIHQLKRFEQVLTDGDYETFYELIQQSNAIRRILK
ncbi:prephenate dehydrogenase [Compostibacter hankyongensis]|uniref:Prephenate dehydrogenase n=1 Tax=Compostibacter hankyongensis TaxID=1007089 RepID=A0ABP8FVC7_9BACT